MPNRQYERGMRLSMYKVKPNCSELLGHQGVSVGQGKKNAESLRNAVSGRCQPLIPIQFLPTGWN